MPIFAFSHFMLDTERQVLLADGRPAGIRGRPVQILAVLVAKAGEIVTQDEIVAAVWRGVVVSHNNLPVQMSILRRQLRVHGADDVIQTLPNQSGYRFAAPVRAVMDQDPPASTPPAATKPPRAVPWLAASAAALAVLLLGAWLRPSPDHFLAHVQVDTRPDTITMAPGGYCPVDYVFHVSDASDLQLDTEDVRFSLVSGAPIGAPSIRGRIYRGSFPISGPGLAIYHNNIFLPPAIAAAAKASGNRDLYLRHLFHLTNPAGGEVDVPAVLMIVLSSEKDACTAK